MTTQPSEIGPENSPIKFDGAHMGNEEERPQGGSNSLLFDGTAQSWAAILEQANVGYPGDLYVLFGISSLTPDLVSGLLEVSECILDHEKKVFYSKFSVFLPPEFGNLELLKQSTSKSKYFKVDFSELVTCDIEELVNQLRKLDPRTIVFLGGLEQIRANQKPNMGGNPSSTWTGIKHRMMSTSTRATEQLEHIVTKLLDVAREQQLFIVAICYAPTNVGQNIDSKLPSQNSFFYGGFYSRALETEREIGELAEAAIGNPELLNIVLTKIEGLTLSNDRKALAKAQIFFGSGKHEQAWNTLEPFLNAFLNETPTVSLTIGHCALAAGRIEQSRKWLELALQNKPTYYEDLYRAYLLSRELNEHAQSKLISEKIIRLFPNEKQTIELQYQQALQARNYKSAVGLGIRLQRVLESQLWDALVQPTDFERLEEAYEKALSAGEGNWCATMIAKEMRHRSDPDGADYWAKMVTDTSDYGDDAVSIRIWAFGRSLLHKTNIEDSDIDELIGLIDFVASNPEKEKSRSMLEDLIEDQIPSLESVTLLGGALMNLLSQCPIPMQGQLRSREKSEAQPAVVLSEVKKIFEEIGSGFHRLGTGKLSGRLSSDINKELMNGFLLVIEHSDYASDGAKTAHRFLLVADLMADALHDPTSDLVAAQLIVQRLARCGEMQAARNLSEEVLRTLPQRRAGYRDWRLGLSWIVYSEAFAFSGNNRAALLTLCLAFSNFRKQVVDIENMGDAIRICTRVLRDLGLVPLALETLEVERQIRKAIGATSTLKQLSQLELSIAIKAARTTSEYQTLLSSAMHQLKDLPEGLEKLPVVSLAVSLVRIVRQHGCVVDEVVIDELRNTLSSESSNQAQILLQMLDRNINKDLLLSLLSNSGNAVRRGDASNQIGPIQILCDEALEIAEKNGDIELFLTAVSLQCQPGLTLAVIDDKNDDPTDNRLRDYILGAITIEKNPANIDAQLKILENLGTQNEFQITSCCEYTTKDLQNAIQKDEQVMIFGIGAKGSCFTCLFEDSGEPQIRRLPPETWTSRRIVDWRRSAPHLNDNAISQNFVSCVADSLSDLSLGVTVENKKLTIIPCAAAFDFPFSLLKVEGRSLGLITQTAVVPSVGWLCAVRAREVIIHGRWVGWVGSDQTKDDVIIEAKRTLGGVMEKYNLDVIAGSSLSPIGQADLAVFISHGVKGYLDQIRSVTDGEDHLGSGEIAKMLGACSCVVLCVCNGANSSTEVGSRDNQGLLAALLASGVRAVVAAPWTVSVDVLEHWLPTFLESARKGECVGKAVSNASAAVEVVFKNTLEWARMQVYGDPYLVLTR